MKAILWDGNKQIKGDLILEEERIRFRLADFSYTDLDFDLAYHEIRKVGYHKLYDISTQGLAIESIYSNINVFIVEKPEEVKSAIELKKGRSINIIK